MHISFWIGDAMLLNDSKKISIFLKGIEVVFLVLCLWIIWSQALSYPEPSEDPDPDGYTSYAERLSERFKLEKEYHRYPGYPLFIAAANTLFQRDTVLSNTKHESVHKLQSIIVVLFAAGLYYFVRRAWGTLIACLSMAILATPNFLVLYTAYPFPDFLYSLCWATCFWYLADWVQSRRVMPGFGLLVFGLTICLMQLIKPNASAILALFAIGLLLSIILVPHSKWSTKIIIIQSSIMCLMVVIVTVFIPLLFGTGPLEFVTNAAKARLVQYLPPASNSQVEKEIEAAKIAWQLSHGVKMEDENFMGLQPQIRLQWIDQVWMQRLMAHPLQYMEVTLDEIRRKHYLIIDQYVPFSANTRNALYVHIMPKSNTIESKLYWSTGLWVDSIGEGTIAIANISRSVIRVILFWSILLIGWSQLFKKYPVFVAAMTMSTILYVILHAVTVYIDSRYMLVFAIPLYLTQAVGLASIIRFVMGLEFFNASLLIASKCDETRDGQTC